MSDHYLKVVAWYGDESPRLDLVCEAAPDAPCRVRLAGGDTEPWSTDEPYLIHGEECWAMKWIESERWEDAVRVDLEADFARIPVNVKYDEGVYLSPAPDNKE